MSWSIWKVMKYRVGQKVRIKTWEAMLKEFIISTSGSISIHKNLGFNPDMESVISGLNTDREVTIFEVVEGVGKGENKHYKLDETGLWHWTDEMIECLTEEIIPIGSRFELLDL